MITLIIKIRSSKVM